jgi:hypothetical protein
MQGRDKLLSCGSHLEGTNCECPTIKRRRHALQIDDSVQSKENKVSGFHSRYFLREVALGIDKGES